MGTVLDRDIEEAIDAAGEIPPPIDLTDATNRALTALLSIAENANNLVQERIAAAQVITTLCGAWLTGG